MRVREDEILRSNGERGIYGVVEKHDAAIILPIDQGRVWLVEQFRYTIQERALELPQGGWEMEVEDPEELARGELREETGPGSRADDLPGNALDRLRLHPAKAARLSGHRADATEKEPDAEEHDLVVRSVSGGGVRGDDAQRRDPRQLHAVGLGALSAVEGAAGR